MSVIIDRRLNDRNKSAVNRERFLRRYKDHIQRSVQDIVAERSIRDMEQGGEVKIPARDIAEPSFRHGAGGDREHVHSGNREYMPGDRIARPDGSGQGAGGGEGGEGESQDAFAFSLSRDEFMQLFFDDLELPRLARTVLGELSGTAQRRAGYARQGAPTSLSVPRSLRNAMGRRVALAAGPRRELEHRAARLGGLLALAPSTEPDALATEGLLEQLESEVQLLRARIDRVPFIDDLDLRYRNRVPVPRPVFRAVMFCLMDVSASMDEHRKDLAKRFFTLLYLFLTRKYEHVDVVFIRHTDDAEEVDEERFFHERKSGGTVVVSALELMREIVEKRYPATSWNVYGAQASDGDAFGADPERSRGLLEREILPRVRHFAYIEVADSGSTLRAGATTLSAAYQRIEAPNFAMRAAAERRDIYPVFRDLFARNAHETA